MGKKINEFENFNSRHFVLVVGAHYGKDFLSVHMVVQILLKLLRQIVFWDGNHSYLYNYNFIIVPILNVDTHKFISDSFGTEDFSTRILKIKNMNDKICKEGKVIDKGVNLSQNYLSYITQLIFDRDKCNPLYGTQIDT